MDMALIILVGMLGVFMIACFKFKIPVGVSMMLAAITGSLLGGHGISIHHLVEGSFNYVNTIMVIATAMIFMKSIIASGALGTLNYNLVKKFHKNKTLLIILLMIVVMFPGMITGSSTAAVLTAGALAAPIFIALGIPTVNTAAIIAMGGILGMIAPPVNLPVMIIGGGIDMPYSGLTVPLMVLTFPAAIFSVLYLGKKHLKDMAFEEIEKELKVGIEDVKGNFLIYTPVILLAVLLVGGKVFPMTVLNMGMPLTFVICTIVAMFTGRRFNIVKVSHGAMTEALPVLSILVGVGMFIQIMTLTGVRGYIVLHALTLPALFLYVAMAVMLPLFGAVSAYGAASVLGVPFLMALITKNAIVTASALSLLTSLGDMMPPTALAGIFAAQIVGLKDYKLVLKKSIVPMVVIVVIGILTIVFANPISQILL